MLHGDAERACETREWFVCEEDAKKIGWHSTRVFYLKLVSWEQCWLSVWARRVTAKGKGWCILW